MVSICLGLNVLTHKLLEKHGCVLSTVATDALVLKHQATSTHIADLIFIVRDYFHAEMLHVLWILLKIKLHFEKNNPIV